MNHIFELNSILEFEPEADHPSSQVIGIDDYEFDAISGEHRNWQSYTLVPVNNKDRKNEYSRWYIVHLKELGLSFVQAIDEDDLPENLSIDPRMTGKAVIRTIGDGEMGTGKSDLICYWDKAANPPILYAKETFEDGSVLYFKTYPLKGLKLNPLK